MDKWSPIVVARRDAVIGVLVAVIGIGLVLTGKLLQNFGLASDLVLH